MKKEESVDVTPIPKAQSSKSLVSWIVRDHRYDHSEFDYDLSKSLVSWIVRDLSSL